MAEAGGEGSAMSGSEVASGIVAWSGQVQVDEVVGVASGCQGLRGIEC
jgi:hypothetical protein